MVGKMVKEELEGHEVKTHCVECFMSCYLNKSFCIFWDIFQLVLSTSWVLVSTLLTIFTSLTVFNSSIIFTSLTNITSLTILALVGNSATR